MFNGSSCGPDSCEQNGIYINRSQSTESNSWVINTTMEIRTGELHPFIMEKKIYIIQCIVEQNLESSSLMTRDNIIIITLSFDPQQLNESGISS